MENTITMKDIIQIWNTAEYIIQIWPDADSRDNGFSYQSIRTNSNIEKVVSEIIEEYEENIKQDGGSIEIIDPTTYDALYHISEDSNHELKKVLAD